MKNYRSERGQALILIALAIAGIAGMVGLVVDGGNAFLDRRNAQNAADSAALAAAFNRIRGGQDIASTALQSAAQNGYNNDGVSNTVEVYSPPKSGPNVGQIEYIQVIITSNVPTYFARVIGRDHITNVVDAVARTKTPEVMQLMHGIAIISLAPDSDCNNKKAFWVHGEATLSILGGGVFVNSNNKTCAFFQNGSGSIRITGQYPISVVGGASIQKPTLLTPGVAVGAIPVSYPPPFFMPKFGCKQDAQISLEDPSTMSPGNWGDEFPPEGVTRLKSGIYCLNNGLDIKHDLKGNDVVFKVESGDIHFDSSANIKLSASNQGDLKGLLIYVPLDNPNKVVLNGASGSVINGTILAPASHILFKGMDSSYGFHSQIIGYTIEADGINDIKIFYQDDQNYDSMTMPEVQLTQ